MRIRSTLKIDWTKTEGFCMKGELDEGVSLTPIRTGYNSPLAGYWMRNKSVDPRSRAKPDLIQ